MNTFGAEGWPVLTPELFDGSTQRLGSPCSSSFDCINHLVLRGAGCTDSRISAADCRLRRRRGRSETTLTDRPKPIPMS